MLTCSKGTSRSLLRVDTEKQTNKIALLHLSSEMLENSQLRYFISDTNISISIRAVRNKEARISTTCNTAHICLFIESES